MVQCPLNAHIDHSTGKAKYIEPTGLDLHYGQMELSDTTSKRHTMTVTTLLRIHHGDAL